MTNIKYIIILTLAFSVLGCGNQHRDRSANLEEKKKLRLIWFY